MKLNLSLAVTLSTLPILGTALGFSSPTPVVAQDSAQATSFYCGRVDNQPATIAKTPRGEVVMIRWTKDMGNYSPQTRCQTVSQRFQTAYTNKTLRFLTSGIMNGQRVICVAQSRSGGCASDGLLFTTRPGDNARAFLVNLMNQSKYATAPAIIQNCIPKANYDASKDVTMDINEFLYQCPPETAESKPQY
jgi:hypothetical protein